MFRLLLNKLKNNNNTWIGITKQFVSRFGRVHTTSLYSITSTIRANLKNGKKKTELEIKK